MAVYGGSDGYAAVSFQFFNVFSYKEVALPPYYNLKGRNCC